MKLLRYELEVLSQDKVVKIAEIGDFLQISDFTSRLTTYLIQFWGYEPLKRPNFKNMQFLTELVKKIENYVPLSNEQFNFPFFQTTATKPDDRIDKFLDFRRGVRFFFGENKLLLANTLIAVKVSDIVYD